MAIEMFKCEECNSLYQTEVEATECEGLDPIFKGIADKAFLALVEANKNITQEIYDFFKEVAEQNSWEDAIPIQIHKDPNGMKFFMSKDYANEKNIEKKKKLIIWLKLYRTFTKVNLGTYKEYTLIDRIYAKLVIDEIKKVFTKTEESDTILSN